MKEIPVYAINLPCRTDRHVHIITQFKNRSEFNLTIFPAIEHKRGAYGLWLTLKEIVKNESSKLDDYFILCEDDHTFTNDYAVDILFDNIKKAQALNADMLSGGYSWFGNAVQISENLFWADKFNGMQFTVIFRRFYQAILDADFGESVITDIHLSGLADTKFVMHPYISTQKEFGYSDVTSTNAKEGYLESIFKASMERLDILKKVKNHYFK